MVTQSDMHKFAPRPKFRRTECRVEGLVYHELEFTFASGKKTYRFVPDDMWKARLADAKNVWVIWNALRYRDELKKPPTQMALV